jgi:hypothetical protein
MPYRVLVDDHFHYQDERYRYELGTFDTLAEAVAACRQIVDRNLLQMSEKNKTAKDLFDVYMLMGDDPFILPVPIGSEKIEFSAAEYARDRSRVITGEDFPSKCPSP